MTEDFVRQQIDQFRTLTSRGYVPPVLKEHTRNGSRYGGVVALEAVQESGVWSIRAGLHLYETDAWTRVENGEYNHVSGGWAEIVDDEGTEYPNVLAEVSLTAAPHVKIDQGRVSMSELLAEKEHDMEDYTKALAEMETRLKEYFDSKMKAMEPEEKEEEEMKEHEEPKEEMTEVTLSEAQFAALKTALTEGLRTPAIKPSNVPPQTPETEDVLVFRTHASLTEYAKKSGKSVLQLLADPDVITEY